MGGRNPLGTGTGPPSQALIPAEPTPKMGVGTPLGTGTGPLTSASIPKAQLSLADFLVSDAEATALNEVQEELNQTHASVTCSTKRGKQETLHEHPRPLICDQSHSTEKSNIVYLQVIDAIADSKDTIMHMLDNLHQQFIVGCNMSWLVVEGDAKVYETIYSLKFEYGEELKWVIPYPGDWHMVMNYQHVLMKAYYDAGLKSLAK